MHRLVTPCILLVAASALALSLLVGSLRPHPVSAALSTCGTDPTVTLSNGKTVSLSTTINTDLSNVTGVQYVLHVPWWVQVTSVSYDQTASLESFSWVADQNGNHYQDDTTVLTTALAPNSPFTAWATLPSGDTTSGVSGVSGETVAVTWKM